MQQELEQAGDATLIERRHFNYPQRRVLALRESNLDLFSAEQISIVDKVIEALRHHSAASVSELSHRVGVGWDIAEDREEIPYETVFVSKNPPSPRDISRAQELAKEHGWSAHI